MTPSVIVKVDIKSRFMNRIGFISRKFVTSVLDTGFGAWSPKKRSLFLVDRLVVATVTIETSGNIKINILLYKRNSFHYSSFHHIQNLNYWKK